MLTRAAAVAGLVIAGGGTRGLTTVRVSVAVPVPPPFVALSVTVKVPGSVATPEINPVAGSMLRMPGRPDAAKPVGLFVAVTW